jgi:hypothetical protein
VDAVRDLGRSEQNDGLSLKARGQSTSPNSKWWLMTPGAWRRGTALAVCASVAGSGLGSLVGGEARAQTGARPASPATPAALSVSVPGVTVSVPSVTPSVPSVSVATPTVSVALPGVTVPVPPTPVAPSGPVSPTLPTTTQSSTATAPTLTSPATDGSGAVSGAPHSAARGGPGPAPAGPPVAGTALAGARDPNPALPGHPRRSPQALGNNPVAAVTTASSVRAASPPSAGSQGVGSSSGLPVTATGSSNPLDSIGRHIPLPLPVPDWSKPIILMLLVLAGSLGVRSRLARTRARRLEGQHATLLEDLSVMQEALVPHVPARLGGLAVSVAYRPADGPGAGGDFYDVFVPEAGKVAVILGDVSGHGRTALSQAALTRYTLRAYIQAGLEPRAALALAGRALADPTSEHFATVAVAVYQADTGTLTYACAGHPAPILRGSAAPEPLEVCCSPLLGLDIPTGRRQTTVPLSAGAVVCLFTDGLIEARCDGGLLGRERLAEILAESGSRPHAASVLDSVVGVADVTPDDMAACVLIPDATAPGEHTYIEELEADAKTFGAIHAQRFLEACHIPSEEITRVLELAGAVAGKHGTAVLRVEISPGRSATACVRNPDPSNVAGSERLGDDRGPHASQVLTSTPSGKG